MYFLLNPHPELAIYQKKHYLLICDFFLENLDINVKSDVIMEKHDGFHFFNVTKVHVKFSIGGLKLHMGNLFDGIKALGKHLI